MSRSTARLAVFEALPPLDPGPVDGHADRVLHEVAVANGDAHVPGVDVLHGRAHLVALLVAELGRDVAIGDLAVRAPVALPVERDRAPQRDALRIGRVGRPALPLLDLAPRRGIGLDLVARLLTQRSLDRYRDALASSPGPGRDVEVDRGAQRDRRLAAAVDRAGRVGALDGDLGT